MSLQFLNVESCEGKQCHGVREASRTITVRYTNTYCVSCFLQRLGCKRRRVDGSLDNSSLELLEILWPFFPLQWSSMYNNMLSSASDSGIHVTDWLPACCNPATLARIREGVSYFRMST